MLYNLTVLMLLYGLQSSHHLLRCWKPLDVTGLPQLLLKVMKTVLKQTNWTVDNLSVPMTNTSLLNFSRGIEGDILTNQKQLSRFDRAMTAGYYDPRVITLNAIIFFVSCGVGLYLDDGVGIVYVLCGVVGMIMALSIMILVGYINIKHDADLILLDVI